MIPMPTPPHVRLLKALEQVVYIGDEPQTVVHRQFINEAALETLDTPYLAILPGGLAMKMKGAGGGEVTVEVTCTVIFQLVQRIGGAAVTELVDSALGMVWANMERIRTSRLQGVEARFVEGSVAQAEAYSEPMLRTFGVFDSRFAASWILYERYGVA